MLDHQHLLALYNWMKEHPFIVSVLVAGALTLAGLLVRNLGDAETGRQRRTATIVLLLVAGLVLSVGGALFLIEVGRWGYLLALLPGATIARHAVYMRLIRRRALTVAVQPPTQAQREPAQGDTGWGALELKDSGLTRVFLRARQMHDLDFAPDTLAIRFGVPALLTTFIGIGVFEFLLAATGPHVTITVWPPLAHGAWMGAAGALVYVLLYLGQRAFRNDITTGAALWSAVTLAAGPLFGAVFALIWKAPTDGATPWTSDALYFVVGMSPRHAAGAVEEAVRRLWLARSTPAVQARTQPLALLRGVTPAIEDRLAEEGITDVQGMGLADPLKLFRSTSFDKRQILGWMDEALLMCWLPDDWAAVEKVGVTGAIDLMAHTKLRESALRTVLKETAKLDDATVEAVVLAGQVLGEDAQLRLVWALYQFDEEDGFDQPAAAPEVSEPVSAGVALPGLGWLLSALGFLLWAATTTSARVLVADLAAPLAALALSFAIGLTVRWPWPGGRARAVPLAAAGVLALLVTLFRGELAALMRIEWQAQLLLLEAAGLCGGLFLVRVLGRTSTPADDSLVGVQFQTLGEKPSKSLGLGAPDTRSDGANKQM